MPCNCQSPTPIEREPAVPATVEFVVFGSNRGDVAFGRLDDARDFQADFGGRVRTRAKPIDTYAPDLVPSPVAID